MRLFDHPLHPLLVHFPIALWSLATACDVLTWFGFDSAWHYAGLSLGLGFGFAVPAIVAGFLDFTKVEGVALSTANTHMLLMAAAWVIYGASFMMRVEHMSLLAQPPPFAIALSLLGFGMMACGGWYGGQLVYHYGVGKTGSTDSSSIETQCSDR